MTQASGRQRELQRTAGPRPRCFLNAALLFSLLTGFCLPAAGSATTCSELPDLGVNKLQGAVYGPSGIPAPLIVVQVSREGESVAETKRNSIERARA